MVETARNALDLWAMQLVPSLLPFMILSSIISSYIYRYSSIKNTRLEKLCQKTLHLSLYGFYILILGHLCGYPLGAKITGEYYKKGIISRPEANYLLTICNQSSPAFLEFYVGVYALNQVLPTHVIFILFYVSTIITSLLTRKLYSFSNFIQTTAIVTESEDLTFFEILDRSISESCKTIIRVGGYVLLFSIIIYAGTIILQPLGDTGSLLVSTLEITNGLSLLRTAFSTSPLYLYFIFLLTGFGGFCTMAQIKGMLVGTSLSIKPYIIGKIIYTIILLLLIILFNKILFFIFQ